MENDTKVIYKTKFIYHRGSFLGSVLSDLITFSLLIGLLSLNFSQWGGRWYVTIFILWIWLLAVTAWGSKKVHKFYSIDECIDYLTEEKSKQDGRV